MNSVDKINITITRDIHRQLMMQGATHGMSPGLYARHLLTDSLGIKPKVKRRKGSRS